MFYFLRLLAMEQSIEKQKICNVNSPYFSFFVLRIWSSTEATCYWKYKRVRTGNQIDFPYKQTSLLFGKGSENTEKTAVRWNRPKLTQSNCQFFLWVWISSNSFDSIFLLIVGQLIFDLIGRRFWLRQWSLECSWILTKLELNKT